MAKIIIIKRRTNVFMRINAGVSVSPIAVSFHNHGYAFSKHLLFRVHFFTETAQIRLFQKSAAYKYSVRRENFTIPA